MAECILSFMSGPRDGETLVVAADGSPPQVQIGRLADCAVSIPDDPDASRRHAALTLRGDAWWLEDLGSANGTYLGEFGRAVRVATPTALQYGQVFRVGLTRFRLEPPDKAAAAMAQATREAEG